MNSSIQTISLRKSVLFLAALTALSACGDNNFRTISNNPPAPQEQIVRPLQVNKPGTPECTFEFFTEHKEVIATVNNFKNMLEDPAVFPEVITERAEEATNACTEIMASATGERECDIMLDNGQVHETLKMSDVEASCKELDTLITNAGAKK